MPVKPHGRLGHAHDPQVRRRPQDPAPVQQEVDGRSRGAGLVLGDRDVDRLLGLDVDEAAAVAKHVPEVGRGDGGVPWWDFDLSL